MAVYIVADCIALVTVVLTSSVHGKLQALEDWFWGCAYRLHHTLKDRNLLPSAGTNTLFCVHHLQKHIDDKGEQTTGKDAASVPQDKQGRAGNPHRADVLQLMADGWMDYISTLMLNSGTCSKVDAWTTINQQLKDLNGRLFLDANFSRLLLRDDTEDGLMSPDMKHSAGKVYDNVTVKLEAWRKALDLVFLVLQTDTEIIIGIDPKQVEGQSNVMRFLKETSRGQREWTLPSRLTSTFRSVVRASFPLGLGIEGMLHQRGGSQTNYLTLVVN
ncbi:unnamed protein product [Coregonus sp. 'balchen']|nr:unnamed protein product [Coregonus sp. 'balchen']